MKKENKLEVNCKHPVLKFEEEREDHTIGFPKHKIGVCYHCNDLVYITDKYRQVVDIVYELRER